ncbi:MAG: phage tail protein [Bacteroidota bacterium]
MLFDYPITSFHFMVRFSLPASTARRIARDGIAFILPVDFAFQSVSGLDVQLETETLKEGGENRFEHTLPLRTKYSNLVLKRSIGVPIVSGLTSWCKQTFEKAIYLPLDLQVILLDENHIPLLFWNVIHAWPVNWKIGELNAEKGEILIETLELKYNYYSFQEL